MEIREQSPERLVLEARPICLPILFAVAMVAGLCGGFATILLERPDVLLFPLLTGGCSALFVLAFAFRIIVFLDRPAGVVLIRSVTVVGQREVVHPIADLRRAVLQRPKRQRSLSSDSKTYRPALTMADGTEVPLWHLFISGNGAARTVTTINDWLEVPAPAA